MKIKKDISIVQEFLGTTDVIELITPLKCCRCYSKKPQNSPCDVVVILTPMLSEDNEAIDKIKYLVSQYGSFTCVEHERKGNKVYTFEMVGG